MINVIFDACVVFLLALARMLGTTYEAVNVWIFCVTVPIAFFALIGFIVYQARQIRELKKLFVLRSALYCDNYGYGMKNIIIRDNQGNTPFGATQSRPDIA